MPPKPVIKGAAPAAATAATAGGSSAAVAASSAKGKSSPAAASSSDPDAVALDASTPSAPVAPAVQDFDLSTCSAQEYLSRTIYPTLAPLLTALDQIRPSNPVEYLALSLIREASTTRERVAQLDQIHEMREGLREQFKREYNVEGRV